jgi:hypothetical protein
MGWQGPLLYSEQLKAKNSVSLTWISGCFLISQVLLMGVTTSAQRACAEDATICAGGTAVCPPSESPFWRLFDIALSSRLPAALAPPPDAMVPRAVSLDANFESSHDSSGLTVHQADDAYEIDLSGCQLTWHDAPMMARASSGMRRLLSQFLQTEFDPFAGIHVDLAFGDVAQYLQDQNAIGWVQAGAEFSGNEVSVSLRRQLLTDSVESISRGIFLTEIALTERRKLLRLINLKAEVHQRSYSDGNSANSLLLSPQYDFPALGGDFGLGYRVRYGTFSHHSDAGYYSPLMSLAQQVFGDVSYDAKPFTAALGLAVGRGATKSGRTSATASDFSGEGTATLGWNVNERVLVEVTAAAGDYGLGHRANRWIEMSTGLRVKYSF